MHHKNPKHTKTDLLDRLYRLEIQLSDGREAMLSHRRDYSGMMKERDALVTLIRSGKYHKMKKCQ